MTDQERAQYQEAIRKLVNYINELHRLMPLPPNAIHSLPDSGVVEAMSLLRDD